LGMLTWLLCIVSSMDNIHHSEIFLSPLLFEDIMDSSSGKLQEWSFSHCTHPPWDLLAITYNVNPRDGAQDILHCIGRRRWGIETQIAEHRHLSRHTYM
jgi:hypothetical protein